MMTDLSTALARADEADRKGKARNGTAGSQQRAPAAENDAGEGNVPAERQRPPTSFSVAAMEVPACTTHSDALMARLAAELETLRGHQVLVRGRIAADQAEEANIMVAAGALEAALEKLRVVSR